MVEALALYFKYIFLMMNLREIQLESLSYVGHCAHFPFTTCVIYFAYDFFFLVMYLYVVIIICK